MYEMAKSAREALKSKARRLAGESEGKVDSTSVKRPKAFTAEDKTGLQPTTKRAYKKGGAVPKAPEGKNAMEALRATKSAKAAESVLPPPGKSVKRAGRKNGGVTVINIGKGANEDQAPMAAPRAPGAPMPQPMTPPPMRSQMPIMPPPPAPAPGAQQPPIALKTGGRAVKVAKSYKDMRAGAGSGEGRLQKTDIAKKKRA